MEMVGQGEGGSNLELKAFVKDHKHALNVFSVCTKQKSIDKPVHYGIRVAVPLTTIIGE